MLLSTKSPRLNTHALVISSDNKHAVYARKRNPRKSRIFVGGLSISAFDLLRN